MTQRLAAAALLGAIGIAVPAITARAGAQSRPATAGGTNVLQAESEARRARLRRLIDRPVPPLDVRVERLTGADPYVGEHVSFVSQEGERVPGLAFKAAGATGRLPVVIALHGTGDRKESFVPMLRLLASRGFLAVAIDGRHHGERESRPGAYPDAIFRAYQRPGERPFLYDTVWDAMRLIDYLETRSDVDARRIGMLGISKGGMETYLTAAIDPRVAVAVPVIAAQSFNWALDHDDAWRWRIGTLSPAVERAAQSEGLSRIDTAFVRRFYARVVPGIDGDFDGPAMLPLIAPRPLLVINGERDSLTPLEGVRECEAAARRAYRLTGAEEKFSVMIQPGVGHEFTPDAQRRAVDWLVTWLKG